MLPRPAPSKHRRAHSSRPLRLSLALATAAITTAPASLVWHSPLDGNANATVGSNGTPNGTPSAVADRDGNANSAVDFSGSGEYYDIGSFGTITAGSLAIWVKPDTFGQSRGALNAGATGSGSTQYFSILTNASGLARVDLDNGISRRDAFSNAPVPSGSWSHLATTWAANGTLRIFVNGVEQSDTQGNLSATYTMTLNGLVGADRPGSRYWNGSLDDGGIWDEELTPRKVAAIHGLAKFVGTELNDTGIDTVVAFSSLGQTATVGGEMWVYVDGLAGATGTTGGSIAGEDAFVVLDGSTGRGIQQSAVILPPVVTNSAATNIAASSATLSGTVTSTGGEPPSVTIYYGDNNAGTNAGAWDSSISAGTQSGAFGAVASSLNPNTTYYFRSFASNSAGSDWANSTSNFTTPAPPNLPVVINDAPGNVSYTSALANGDVISTGGEDPEVIIFYGDNNGGTIPASWDSSVNAGIQNGKYTQTLAGLTDGTTYYYRARAANSAGTDWAPSSETFTTLAYALPTLTNSAATAITGGGAQVGGTVTSTGGDAPTVTVHYGTTDGGTNAGAWTDSVIFSAQTGAFSTPINGLTPNTTYFYTASGTNIEGTAWATPSLSFTTPDVSDIFVNEFMASNDGATPVPNQIPGTSEDWIEIYNSGATAIDLGGWHLTDNVGTLNKWTFPAGTNVPAGGYLVVFASNDDAPDANGNLHTNFKLSAGGEYVALVRPDLSIASEFGPAGTDYPGQETDISYGLHPSSLDSVFFAVPTPGAANDPGGVLLVADTNFSHKRGYYTAPINVAITSDTAGANIRYTTDGTEPTLTNGSTYGSPIAISDSTVLRARAYKTGQLETNIDTQSYIYPVEVATQTKPVGYPNNWANNDYNVDTAISQSGTYSARFQEGLRSVPTLSIVGDPDDFFGAGGIWVETQNRNVIKPVSAEYFHPDPAIDGANILEGFQIDCAAKLQGGASRNPGSAVKHSMSLRFKDGFGPGKLNFPLFEDSDVTSFDSFQLRAMYNNSWVHSNSGQRARATMIRDQWARSSMIDMGNADGGHGHFTHVYINGLYWGLYNMHERLENDHYASYNGYSDDEVLGRNPGTPTSEENASYNQMISVVTNSGSTWSQIEAVLDVDNYIDYVIVEYFGRNADLKNNDNWRCAGGGTANAPWRFYCWDTERIFENPSNTSPPSNSGQFDGALIFDDLEDHREFRLRFSDRAYKHLFNTGALTNTLNRDRFQHFATQIDTAIVCESARWGDDRGTTYTRDNHWTRAVYGTPSGPGVDPQNGVMGSWFPTSGTTRTDRIVSDWQNRTFTGSSDTYLGNIDAPLYTVNGSNQHGGEIPSGGSVSATAASGSVYYTTDGTDPRLEGGGVAPGATLLSGNINLSASGLVRARSRVGGGDSWSPLTEATFYLEALAGAGDLAITELNYHPHEPTVLEQQAAGGPFTRSDFEFVEVENLSAGAINLDGVNFGDGVTGTAGPFAVAPGAHAVFVANPDAFAARYGAAPFAGTFTGDLNNGGETVQIQSADGTVLETLTYDDSGSWPGRADGNASSLERISPTNDPNSPDSWRSSSEYGGSPAAAGLGPDNRIVINEVLSHTDLPDVDTIELHNTTGAAIDVKDWYLSDSNSTYRSFRIPTTAIIPAGGYITFDESDFNQPQANGISAYSGTGGASPTTVTTSAPHGLSDGDIITISDYGGFGEYNGSYEVDVTTSVTFTIDATFLDNDAAKGTWTPERPFALSSTKGETLYLLQDDNAGGPARFVDSVDFGAAFNGETLGRWPNGAGSSTLIPMSANTLTTTNTGPRIGPIIISEVQYHPSSATPDGLEFVEICNAGTVSENLANWRLRGGADFDFTAAHQLAPGGLLVIVPFDPNNPADANAFRSFYGIDASIPLAGPFSDGPLGDDTGTVRLQRPDSPPAGDPSFYPQVTEDTVTYLDTTPWPEDADGDGESLNRDGASSFGDFATSWLGALPTPGGKAISYTQWAAIYGVGTGDLDEDADGVSNLLEFAFDMNPLAFDADLLPCIDEGAGTMSLTYPVNTLLPGIAIKIQRSTDLSAWTDLSTSLDSTSGYTELRTATVATPGEQRIFLRITVEEIP